MLVVGPRGCSGMSDELDALREAYFDRAYVESFQIGQKIRAYDFRNNRDCYIEGIIRKIAPWDLCRCGEPHLHIEVTLDTLPEVARLQQEEGGEGGFQVDGELLDPSAEVRHGDDIEARDWVFPVIPTSKVRTFSSAEMLEVLP